MLYNRDQTGDNVTLKTLPQCNYCYQSQGKKEQHVDMENILWKVYIRMLNFLRRHEIEKIQSLIDEMKIVNINDGDDYVKKQFSGV